MTSLSSFLSLWNLSLESPPIETKTGIVARVRWEEYPCILKIASEGGDEKTAAVLKLYKGQGAVRVIKSEKEATLLERAIPGIPLSNLVLRGEDDRATEILCEVIRKLHTPKEILDAQMTLENLEKSFDRYLQSTNAQIPQDLVKEAHTIYRDLVKSQTSSFLLHGDLHHDNVLYDETRGWLAIDPKGYIGDPSFEVGAMLRNPQTRPALYQNPERIHRRVSILCEKLNFERDRVLQWAFSQAVLARLWSIEDKEPPEWALGVALKLRNLMDKQLLWT